MEGYKRDKQILRDLALRLAEISSDPRQETLRKEWIKHNDMEQVAPRVLIYPDGDGAWREIIPPETLRVSDPFLRECEYQLRQKIYHWEHFHDDFVFEPEINIDCVGEYTGYHYAKADHTTAWGLSIQGQSPADLNGGSYAFKPALNTEEDLQVFLSHKLDFIYDETETKKRVEMLEDILGDILKVTLSLPYVVLVASLLIELVHLRGLTQMLFDLYDKPEFFHRVMEHMSSSKLELLQRLERENRLFLNNKASYTGSGGLAYTNRLPQKDYNGSRVRLKDLWGFADAQEFTDVSPDMFREFVLPYQKKALSGFGLVCYGCCEKLDDKLDDILEIPNIWRISVSPWSDINIAAEKIGRKCIYSRKPNPSFVAEKIDEEAVKNDLKNVLEAAKGCNLEIILKDLRTCGGNPENLIRWVDIAQSICKG
ncbi:MAG TPA: hypothetical protein GXX14_00995 [Clostridiaceae bacterium]|nr:hypothetical protein [Clostridiaceae bacterium]